MRKGCGYALVALATGLALAVGLVARRVDLGDALDDADRAARDYRAQGLPWTAADILPPPVPAARNAGPGLRRAADAVRRLPYVVVGAPATVLDRFVPGMALVHEAVKRPLLDFGRDPDLGMGLRLPEHTPLINLARAFATRAARRAATGDDGSALADLEDARRLGALLAQEPDMIAAFASESCLEAAYDAARTCLASAAKSPSRLVRYRRWLARPVPPLDVARAWRGEIYSALATARNLSREQIAGFLVPGLFGNPWRAPARTPILREGLPDDPLARAFTARCLRANAEFAALTHGLRDSLGTLVARSHDLRARMWRDDGLSHALDDLIFPVYRHLDRLFSRRARAREMALARADALLRRIGSDALPVHGGRLRVWSADREG